MFPIDSGILLCEAVANRAALIRTAIIHKDDFQIFIGLPDDAANAPFQIGFHLVYGYNNADQFIHA